MRSKVAGGSARLRGARPLALLMMGSALGWGCGRDDGRVPVYATSGQVRVGSEAPEGALVVLHGVSGQHADLRPTGKVRADGSFALTTYEAEDGAPAGDYVATIQWNKLVRKGNDYSAGPNQIAPSYATPEKSPWKIRVAAAPNAIPPLTIAK